MRLDLTLPADSLLPGVVPAQDAKCSAEGNRLMSAPVSATMTSAVCPPMPGMVRTTSQCCDETHEQQLTPTPPTPTSKPTTTRWPTMPFEAGTPKVDCRATGLFDWRILSSRTVRIRSHSQEASAAKNRRAKLELPAVSSSYIHGSPLSPAIQMVSTRSKK